MKDKKGKDKEKIKAFEYFTSTRINESLLHEIVVNYLANQRKGTASTKTRSEVSGGGAKPWKQKGTGRARAGSNRSPIWRGGGVIFGPTNERSFKKCVPKKKRQKATLHVIIQRIREDNLKIADEISLTEPKTRHAVDFLKKIFGDIKGKKILIVVNKKNDKIIRSFRNIKNVSTCIFNDISYIIGYISGQGI